MIPGKQQMMAQVLRSMAPTGETWTELLALGITQLQLLQTLGA